MPRSALTLIPPDVLRRVPGCEDGAPPQHAKRMVGGSLANACIDLLTARGRFALRLRLKHGPRAGADTWRELKLQRLAARAGLAPAVLDADPAAGWLLMEFVDARSWSAGQLQQLKRLDALMGRVRLLQTLAVADEPVFDPMKLLQLQLSLSSILEPAWQGPLEDLLRAAEPLILECQVQPGRAVAAHGDLNVGNLLGTRPMLIDWEYAQFADPLHDLACLLAYYPQLEPRARHLLGQLGRDDPENRERLALQKRLWGLINGLWKSLHGG